MAKKESRRGAGTNVHTGPNESPPEELASKDFVVRRPPDTINHSTGLASGKAGMRFVHKPLMPEQNETSLDEHKIKHRSTSGAPGHGIVGN